MWMDLESAMLSEVSHKEKNVCAQSLQSCSTLCNPMDCSPPGSSVHGILHARILEWAAITFLQRSSQPRDWTWEFFTCLLHCMQSHQGSLIYYMIFSNNPFSKLLFSVPVSRHAIDLNVLASKEGMFPTRDDTIPTNLEGRRKWQPTPVFLRGESHGQRSLVGYSPRGRKESDKTEGLHSLSLHTWAGSDSLCELNKDTSV